MRRTLDSEEQQGTTILVTGINKPLKAKWQDEIIAAVIANFFYAIDNDKLEIMVDSGEEMHIIDRETLPKLLADRKYQDIEDAVLSAHSYYGAIKEGVERDKTFRGRLEHCKLWTRAGEDLPRKVAIVRQTGMLITDNLLGLRQWPGHGEFSAVCVCDSDEGNALLRRMENPEHNDFHPPRLKADEQIGVQALRQLTKWIRVEVKKLVGPVVAKSDEINELAELLPDQDPIEQLPGEGEERDFEGNSHFSWKPIRPRSTSGVSLGPSGVPGDGTGTNGNGSGVDGGSAGRSILRITAVRILPDNEDRTRKTVLFTPLESGTGRLTISVAGDSYVEPLCIVHANQGERVGSGLALTVVKDEREQIDVQLSEPIDDALTVSLVKKTAPSKTKK